MKRLLVIGGGWAGLAAAVRGVQLGARVTLLEMASQLGGRARSWQDAEHGAIDSGQHILIGAYSDTLALMRTVGVDPDRLLHRLPLTLVNPSGQGLRWGAGSPFMAAAGAIWRHPFWTAAERIGLVTWGLRLALRGLRIPADWSVAQLCQSMPPAVRRGLAEPLCVAALNTRIEQASASVFLTVLRDALFGGRGAADLLLPAAPLSALLPEPAGTWLASQGAAVKTNQRAQTLERSNGVWHCGEHQADAVVLACSATEAARLVLPINAAWSAMARALPAEAIATVEWQVSGPRLPAPMVALAGGPAQFVFDLGQIDGARSTGTTYMRQGRFAAVASAVAADVNDGLEALTQRIEAQVAEQIPALAHAPRLRSHVDRRATFACHVQLARPPAAVAPGLWAAGDYVHGPYPATLEAAVRTGQSAAQAGVQHNRQS